MATRRSPRARWLATGLAVALGFALPVAASHYGRGVSAREAAKVTLAFPGPPGKPATIDLARFGDLKKAVQPWHFRLFVSVANNTAEPRRVGLRIEDCRLYFDWAVRDHSWSPSDRATAEPLPPGGRLTLYLFTEIPEDLRGQTTFCDGRLVAFAPETGETLAQAPLRVVDGQQAAPAPEHHPDGSMHVH